MSTTVRQALGLMSSAGTGKLPAALLTSTSMGPSASIRRRRKRWRWNRLPDVALGGEGGAACCLHRIRRPDSRWSGVAAEDADRRTQPSELGGDGLAQTGATPGDDDHGPR